MDEYRYRQSVELWLVNNQLVAQQQAFVHAFFKESYYEVKHYYCPSCGNAWGLRVAPNFQSPSHHYYQSTCKSCGGDEQMLTPWEQGHLDVLGPNVLAYLILQQTLEVDHEVLEDSIQ